MIKVLAVSVGKPSVLMERRGEPVLSGIVKAQLPAGPIEVGKTNIVGDGQADLVNHGGVDKAVYVYPSEHLPLWLNDIGYDGGASAFGENLTLAGIMEQNAFIGDIWQWGAVTMQIAQPRWPCYKLAARTGHPDIIKRLVNTGRSGWYMRVLATGTTHTDSPIEVIEQDPRRISVLDAFSATINRNVITDAERERFTSHPLLSKAWRDGLILKDEKPQVHT